MTYVAGKDLNYQQALYLFPDWIKLFAGTYGRHLLSKIIHHPIADFGNIKVNMRLAAIAVIGSHKLAGSPRPLPALRDAFQISFFKPSRIKAPMYLGWLSSCDPVNMRCRAERHLCVLALGIHRPTTPKRGKIRLRLERKSMQCALYITRNSRSGCDLQ